MKSAGIAMAGLALFLSGCQEHLIFFPQPPGPPPGPPRHGTLERVDLSAADGTALAGWMVRADAGAGKRSPLVIYFGGNAEEVSWMAGESHRFEGWSLLAMNYRGYGESRGSPGEAALFSDALTIFDYALTRDDVDRERITVMGRSLGSGVAVHVASSRPVAGALLVTPFDSLQAVGEYHYPFLPVRWLLRHRFDSLALAPSIRAPALIIAAQRDSVVPAQHAKRLHDAWAGPREWLQLEGAGHNDVDAHAGYWRGIRAFLGRMESPRK